VIDTVLNLLFRCSHKRLTRPITPVSKEGERDCGTYVVCLECGKQFAYDLNEMRIGKAVSTSSTVGVSVPDSGFTFGGLRGRSNNVSIDGLDNNDEYVGSSRTELSLSKACIFACMYRAASC
jgi:hypothetical protein